MDTLEQAEFFANPNGCGLLTAINLKYDAVDRKDYGAAIYWRNVTDEIFKKCKITIPTLHQMRDYLWKQTIERYKNRKK